MNLVALMICIGGIAFAIFSIFDNKQSWDKSANSFQQGNSLICINENSGRSNTVNKEMGFSLIENQNGRVIIGKGLSYSIIQCTPKI